MQPEDIRVERRKEGIFAVFSTKIFGTEINEILWSKVGHEADLYKDKTDDEIRIIAYQHWNKLKSSIMRRRRFDK
jgi:hypothetical protein